MSVKTIRQTKVRTETCQECHWEVPIGAYHPHLHCTLAKFYGIDPEKLLAGHGYTRSPS